MAKWVLMLMEAAVLAGLSVLGCRNRGPVDPYPAATLRQVELGQVVGKGYRDRLVGPQVEVLSRNPGLVRDGIPYSRTDVLRGLESKKMALTTPITREADEGRTSLLLHGIEVKLRVADAPYGIALILKLMAQRGYPFDGGVLMMGTEEYGSRMTTKIVGAGRVICVKYGNRVVSG
jgi:hypothetical protein